MSLRGWPLISPSKSTAVCVESQSCVSCGDDWKYHTILPGVRVERDDRRGEEVVARAVLVRDDRLRIAGRDEDQVELGIVGDRLPRHAAAVLRHLLVRPGLRARLALLLRHDVPAPLQLAGRRIVRVEVAGNVEVVAADAGDHVVLDDDRRDRAVVELIEIADRLVPALRAVLDVERHEIAVGRLEVQPVAGDRRRRGCRCGCRPSTSTRSARSRGPCARRPPTT